MYKPGDTKIPNIQEVDSKVRQDKKWNLLVLLKLSI